MIFLYGFVLVCLAVSSCIDFKKTLTAVKVAGRESVKITPLLILMVILVTLFLFIAPEKIIATYLGGDDKWVGFLFAMLLGSITIMPGFIAFPLCGLLLKKGVSYMVLSAFANTLMMVGVATFPFEKAYFGTRVAIMRNVFSLLIAVIVALATGFFYGELF